MLNNHFGEHSLIILQSRNFPVCSGYFLEDVLHTFTTRHKRTYMAALLRVAKTCKYPQCLATEEWIKSMWYSHTEYYVATFKKNGWISPGWCGSVDWVLACEPKGCWFNSQSGNVPGLWARSPVGGVQEETIHWYFSPSLFSFSSPLKINK